MWDQLVADENENAKQGCLLAHTMGLGKTMQVITLLVAIAEAALSAEESVSSQIPINLRNSKTLILCPPGLIDNWMDELLIWAPTDSLGSLRKVDAAIKANSRWSIIEEWYNDGGVLVLGYEMFRNIIENKKKASRDAPSIDEELHAQIKMQLTEGPNIVIADEAHKRMFQFLSVSERVSCCSDFFFPFVQLLTPRFQQ
jgi:SNF2 family DNA or RNA helicase